jgi:hypothetical protein
MWGWSAATLQAEDTATDAPVAANEIPATASPVATLNEIGSRRTIRT